VKPRTYYDLDFAGDHLVLDGDQTGTPLAVKVYEKARAPLPSIVLLDVEQVANVVKYLQAWLAERGCLEMPVTKKWADG
jgi:hypothetical protein